LLIVTETLRGGVGGVVRDQTEWFAERGWLVSVAAPIEEEVAKLSAARHHPVGIPTSSRKLGAMVRASRRTRALIRSVSPDVIHCHGLRSFAITRLASSIRPHVTLHGTGRIVSDPVGYGLIRRLVLRTTPLLAATAFDAAPEHRPGWTFVPHASPRLASLVTLPFPEPGSDPVFLWLGRLSEPKLPSLFVEAISRAARERPLRGILVGDGPLSGDVQRLIEELDAPVDVMGHSDDVTGLLSQAWALVLFSRFEALAFSAQEAMWAGRPVIGSPLPGLEWLLGETGLQAGDVESAVRSILQLTERDHAAALGAKAAVRIRELIVPGDPWPTVEAAYLRRREALA
jgi:glycosyltransferase involved in cell wall biosynthesis